MPGFCADIILGASIGGPSPKSDIPFKTYSTGFILYSALGQMVSIFLFVKCMPVCSVFWQGFQILNRPRLQLRTAMCGLYQLQLINCDILIS